MIIELIFSFVRALHLHMFAGFASEANVQNAGCECSINQTGWMSALGRPGPNRQAFRLTCCARSDACFEPRVQLSADAAMAASLVGY